MPWISFDCWTFSYGRFFIAKRIYIGKLWTPFVKLSYRYRG